MEVESLFSAWPGPLRAYQRPEMKLGTLKCSEPLTNSVGELRDSKDAEVVHEHSILSSTFSSDLLRCCVETPALFG